MKSVCQCCWHLLEALKENVFHASFFFFSNFWGLPIILVFLDMQIYHSSLCLYHQTTFSLCLCFQSLYDYDHHHYHHYLEREKERW